MIDDEHAQRFFDLALDLEDMTPDEIRAPAAYLRPNVPTARRDAWREGLGIDEAETWGIVDGFLRDIVRGPSESGR